LKKTYKEEADFLLNFGKRQEKNRKKQEKMKKSEKNA